MKKNLSFKCKFNSIRMIRKTMKKNYNKPNNICKAHIKKTQIWKLIKNNYKSNYNSPSMIMSINYQLKLKNLEILKIFIIN